MYTRRDCVAVIEDGVADVLAIYPLKCEQQIPQDLLLRNAPKHYRMGGKIVREAGRGRAGVGGLTRSSLATARWAESRSMRSLGGGSSLASMRLPKESWMMALGSRAVEGPSSESV